MSIEIYPKNIVRGEDGPLYFVEFINWENNGSPTRWKLYQRGFIFSMEEHMVMVNSEVAKAKGTPEGIDSYKKLLMSMREGHPYSLLEDEVLPDHCVPNKAWIMWMVDALNDKASKSV